ncbi:hypothetical protein [Stutzerimonas xanthomarina]|uniref:hypothetical protein n=1 Tax=Stutzerimonas xanthomarina TaxID=271420 RepID=UPI0012EBB8B0|nr:hypothetical protein [Stutzerimonas xanthomarina]MCP9339531.1 hypothetical protein [Stutzerimonas xanthomarina]
MSPPCAVDQPYRLAVDVSQRKLEAVDQLLEAEAAALHDHLVIRTWPESGKPSAGST